MEVDLPDGIPLVRDYRALIESDGFKAMERFSDGFLHTNKKHLREYMQRWVEDPLHQWSRQWEYPFVFSRAREVVQQEPAARILDAGSGVTFFPYYLRNQFENASVHCCDYDETLAKTFRQINESTGNTVEFSNSDLRELPYGNEWFHMVYCISVLEHTDEYAAIIDEFSRVLRPGGRLAVTFDVSLDGTYDISVDKGTSLLSSLGKPFETQGDLLLDLRSYVSLPGIFTTSSARAINPGLLPWKHSAFMYRIKSFIVHRRFGPWPPPLAVFCLGLTKRSA